MPRRFRMFAAALLALAGLPAAVRAGDGTSGLRLGVFLQGYALPADESKPALAKADLNGFGGGATLGYDWSVGGRWVVGFEADGVLNGGNATLAGSRYDTDHILSLRGRLGYRLYPDLVVYGTGGYARHGITYRGATTPTVADPSPLRTVSGNLDGFAIGGGVEWRHHGFIVFSEYLYTSFERWDFTGGFGINHSLDTDAHQFRVGVKRAFDFP